MTTGFVSFRYLARYQGIEDDAIDRISGIEEIAHCGTAGRGADAKVLFLKGIDNHISNVTIIIDNEIVLRPARHSDHRGWPSGELTSALRASIVILLRRCVGNVYYQAGGNSRLSVCSRKVRSNARANQAIAFARCRDEALAIEYCNFPAAARNQAGTLQLPSSIRNCWPLDP